VLDTPPDTHALDFLARPNILSGFIENGVMSWMIKPFHIAQKLGAGAIFKAGGRLMSGISSVTGVKMLRLVAEFLVLMEDVIIGFNRVGREVAESLKKSTTGFVLVSAPYNNAVRSAGHLMKELQLQNYSLLAIILNRNIPFALQESIEAWDEWQDAPKDLHDGFAILAKRQHYAATLADQLLHRAERLFAQDIPLYLIEEQSQMIHSEESLWQFVDALSSGKLREKSSN
jgi:anion-transporting  ArsA/GET3 family ATPase